MSAFNGFPNLPGPDEVAYCMLNEQYCCASSTLSNITTFSNATKDHPEINVTKDVHHQHVPVESGSLYLDVEDNIFKKLTSVWYNEGLREALIVGANNRDSPFLAWISSYALKIAGFYNTFQCFLRPHLKDIGPKMVNKYSRTRYWGKSPVKCLAWHPHTTKIAVATANDNVRVYCSSSNFVPVLKSKAQWHISSLHWRPYSNTDIAVGCEQGVIVWMVDENSTFVKSSSSNSIVLKRAGHSPVTDVCWSPNGDVLISCSAADTSMLVWDVTMELAVPVRRIGGMVFARWSYDATKVFAATSSIKFRVWKVPQWVPDRWCTRGGRVVAACWSPKDVLLFAAEGEPIVYSLNTHTSIFTSSSATKAQPILDVTKVELSNGDSIGGPILDMCWDPTGKYLAILFEESPIVAIFNTTHQLMQLLISPCCFVNGMDMEIPLTIAFQQNFNEGACLTIAWSSGRIQHFPIVFTDILY